jgi:ribosomal protein S27E
MERINKEEKPIYYKNAEEMDKPMSALIDELRNEISRTRGKLFDIKRSYGWEEQIKTYEGGLTCMISAMANFKKELIEFEQKQHTINHKKITCLECNSTIPYDDVDVKDNGYEYFFGHKMNGKLLYVKCSNCQKPIFLDGNTRMPKY